MDSNNLLSHETEMMYGPDMDLGKKENARFPGRQRTLRWFVGLVALLALYLAYDATLLWIEPTATGAAVGLSVGLLLVYANRSARPKPKEGTDGSELATPLSLAPHPELLVAFNSVAHSLTQLAGQSDEILKEAAILKLATVQQELRTLASGKIVFSGTESWRTLYERILRSPGISRYLSVAWLRSEDYWRDAPGQHSIQLNFELLQLGLCIERTLILNDFFWPPGAALPTKVIHQWVAEQYERGIVMRLVRESEVKMEPDLLADIGIYGDRACGLLELDDQCQTVRFTLDFDVRSVQQYEERWRRLLLFAVNFQDLLDHSVRDG